MQSAADVRAIWLAHLHSTRPADRPRAEAAVRRFYAAAGFPEPRHLLWFDSPFAASWAVALLVAPHHFLWGQRLAPAAQSRDDRRKLDRARSTLGERLGLADWNQVLAAMGGPRGMHLQMPPVVARMLHPKLVLARLSLSGDVSGMFVTHDDDDDLHRAEQRFWGSNKGALRSALHCPTTDSLIGQSFFEDYSFSTMADDEHRVGDREPPPIMLAVWDIARSAGLWWPFEHGAILSERPAELHLDDRKLLHRADGPAAVFRDDWRVYAWHGMALPERWILHPEAIPARDVKHLDASFRKHVASVTSAAKQPASKKTKRGKPSAILAAPLRTDAGARIEQLRAHAGGRLPLFDRYQAGDHRQVWTDLIALGSEVREDPHAADALAVAYETMRRVDANLRTVVERLVAMGYTFTTDAARADAWMARAEDATRVDLDTLGAAARRTPRLGGLLDMVAKARDLLANEVRQARQQPRDSTAHPHVPPDPGVGKRIADVERRFGTLPLSLRAFYEVVGAVNLLGHHPSLAPRGGAVAPDPLVVYDLDESLIDPDDGEDRPPAITIAPDDLHKADTSGGDPYEMALADLRADGELLNERHHLFFVDYLRLAFAFGGFPGYDGMAEVPAEIEALKKGLIEF